MENKIQLKTVLAEAGQIFKRHWNVLILAGGIYVVTSLLGGELVNFYKKSYPETVWIFNILIYIVLFLFNIGLIKYFGEWVKLSYDKKGNFKSESQNIEVKIEKKELANKNGSLLNLDSSQGPALSELWRNWHLLIPFLFASLGTNLLSIISSIPFILLAGVGLFKAFEISWQEAVEKIANQNWTEISTLLMPANWSTGQIFFLILTLVMIIVGLAVYFYVWSRYYLTSYNVVLSKKPGRYTAGFGETSDLVRGHQWQLAVLYAILTLLNIIVAFVTMGLGTILTIPFMCLAYIIFYQKLVQTQQVATK